MAVSVAAEPAWFEAAFDDSWTTVILEAEAS
jgi:hypothetical protein